MSYTFKVKSLKGYEGWSLVTFKGKLYLVRNGGGVHCGCCLKEAISRTDEEEGALEAGKKFIDALKRAGRSQTIRVSGIDGRHQLEEWLGEDSVLIQPCAVNGKANQGYDDVKELDAAFKSFMGRRD